MFTLLNEIHFWSLKPGVDVKDVDFGTFQYYEKKDVNDDYSEVKKKYCDSRGILWSLTNKRPFRLKDKLKEFEEYLEQSKVVFVNWLENSIIQVMLSIGLIIYLHVNVSSGDLSKIVFDRYLLGKLQSDSISSVVVTSTHMLITYNDNQITVINFGKLQSSHNLGEKLINLDPRMQVLELAGPSNRRLEKNMCTSKAGDRIIIWWRSTKDEVYPWSPVVKDYDRANVHIYGIVGLKMELLCYRHSEFDPVAIFFSSSNQDAIVCVEQKVTHKGEVSVEVATYEMIRSKLNRLTITSIPLQTQVCCNANFGEKIAFGCIDGSIVLFDQVRDQSLFVKAAFIPSIISWHPDECILTVANEKGQIQFFDTALTNIKCQLVSDDFISQTLLDLSNNFKNPPTLLHAKWNSKFRQSFSASNHIIADSFLLVVCEHGPIAMIRMFVGSGADDEHGSLILSGDRLVHYYLHYDQVEEAISMLLSLDWETRGRWCLAALHQITEHLLARSLTPLRESQLERALGSYHSPAIAHSAITEDRYADSVHDMTRRFFHRLMRHDRLEKAFLLAVDLDDHDLFMDLHRRALLIDDAELASVALEKAQQILDEMSSENSDDHSTCSNSSCSECASSTGSESERTTTTVEADVMLSEHRHPPSERSALSTSTNYRLVPPAAYTPPLPQPNRLKPQTERLFHPQAIQPPYKFPPVHPNADLYAQSPAFTPGFFTANKLHNRHPQSPQSSLDLHLANRLHLSMPNLTTQTQQYQSSNKTMAQPSALPPYPRPVTQNTRTISMAFGGGSPNLTPYRLQPPFRYRAPPVEIVHPTFSMNLPPPSSLTGAKSGFSRTINTLGIPIVHQYGNSAGGRIISNASQQQHQIHHQTLQQQQQHQSIPSKIIGEQKNKVKFSDTVTAFIVPDSSKNGKQRTNHFEIDPQKELEDSLPLSHPSAYLKDFARAQSPVVEKQEQPKTNKIKVVHFGVV